MDEDILNKPYQRTEKLQKARLDRYGYYIVAGTFIWPLLQLGILLAIVQRLDIPQIWLYFAINMIVLPAGILVVAKVNPELLSHRGRWRQKKDTKTWDKVLVRLFGLAGLYLPIIIAALDIGKYRWIMWGPVVWSVGIVLFIVGNVILYWAMLVNRYFESTVRLQTDRNQTVITDGPYQYVRHPGYVGAILWIISGPLMLGSALSLIPTIAGCLLLVLRTSLEDNMLCKDLQGYVEYARQTQYRLVPGIW